MTPGVAGALAFATAWAASPAPSGEEILAAANRIVAPEIYRGEVEMTTYRADGTSHQYAYRAWKRAGNRLRIAFLDPPVLHGHEALRRDDDLWRYVPSLKRAMRVASRDDFEDGDFRQADVLRVDLTHDYRVTALSAQGATWVLELAAATPEAGYDRVRYTVRQADHMPVREEFFTASGKKLRTLDFSELKELAGQPRPTVLTMTNEITRGRSTVMRIRSLEVLPSLPDRLFELEALGR